MAKTSTTTHVDSLVKERLKEELRKRFAAGGASAALAPTVPELHLDVEDKVVVASPLEEVKPVAVTVGGGQVLASVLLGFPVTPDFAVDVLRNEDLPPQVAAFVPMLDTAYSVHHTESVQLLKAIQHGDKTLISGPTGSGKSSLVQYICALTNRPMVRLNMSGDVESANIFGQLTAKDGATVWKDGAATEAVRYGAVLVNDEWDVTPPEIMFGYQWLMEDNGKLYLKEMPGSSEEKMITPHREFRFVCLGNTLGQGDDSGKYAGTNVQNTATLDRFQTTIQLGYLSEEHELGVLKNVLPSLSGAVAKKMIQFATLVRGGYMEGQLSLSISPRTLINWGRKVDQWDGDVRMALSLAYLNKLSDNEKGVAGALLKKVFG